MPVLHITSNSTTACNTQTLQQLSALVAQLLGKPERYVMVNYQHNDAMLFAGTEEPLAYCELKSLGLTQSQTKPLSEALCSAIAEHFAIDQKRIYIEFSAPERSMFGWNGSTF